MITHIVFWENICNFLVFFIHFTPYHLIFIIPEFLRLTDLKNINLMDRFNILLYIFAYKTVLVKNSLLLFFNFVFKLEILHDFKEIVFALVKIDFPLKLIIFWIFVEFLTLFNLEIIDFAVEMFLLDESGLNK